MQRNFEPMRKQVEAWQRSELTDVTAKVVIVVGQIRTCRGCCAANVERGLREVPVAWLKSEWRRRGPLKRVQLTISGCVGAAEAKMQESWDKNSLQICADCPPW
jgi:hypothetical protein